MRRDLKEANMVKLTVVATIYPHRFHFDSLAYDNEARQTEIESIETIVNDRGDGTPSAIRLSGLQDIMKFNKPNPDKVRIWMALYRVEEKPIDIVVSFNVPLDAHDGGAVSQDQLSATLADFDRFTRSFCIKDFGLFA
jgi:hypothetical protein